MIHKNPTSALLAISLLLLSLSPASAAEPVEKFPARIDCEGHYPGHLQGICLDDAKDHDDQQSIYWVFTTWLVKTDMQGKLIKKVPVVSHHGDLCYADGKLYVAVNLGQFNNPEGKADSWVYVYDAKDLKELARHETQQVKYGAGGMATHEGRFLVIGGLPSDFKENYLYEFDGDFNFIKKHTLDSGHTHLGIQGAAYSEGTWWFACYGSQILTATADLKMQSRHTFQCGYGIVGLGNDQYYIARGDSIKDKGRTGYLLLAKPDKEEGLVIIEK